MTIPWTEDPRLVAVYDTECSGRRDHEFYLQLADRLAARRVTDVGCGTGVLAVALAARGHEVTGLDPSGPMLDVARRRAGGVRVRWVRGHADALPAASADLVVMTGHVAQYFVTEEAWEDLLGHAWRVLAPGGRLAFESRNPAARAWEGWDRESTRARYPHPDGGTFTSWVELVRADEHDGHGPVETHRGHTLLPGGQHLQAEETLRFRPLPALVSSVEAAGLDVEASWGDWDGSALRPDSAELILLARRPEPRP